MSIEFDESPGMIALRELQEDLKEYPLVVDIPPEDVVRVIVGMRFQVTFIDERNHALVLEPVLGGEHGGFQEQSKETV